jgi:hypothetical protein
MRNRGVQAMLCPCIDCLNQKQFAQREIIFHHLVTRGFTKKYTCWNKHGEEGLNELEAGYLNEGEVRHHATEHGLRISLIKKLGVSMMVRCCNMCTMLIKF